MAIQKRFTRALKNSLPLDSNRTLIWHCLLYEVYGICGCHIECLLQHRMSTSRFFPEQNIFFHGKFQVSALAVSIQRHGLSFFFWTDNKRPLNNYSQCNALYDEQSKCPITVTFIKNTISWGDGNRIRPKKRKCPPHCLFAPSRRLFSARLQ